MRRLFTTALLSVVLAPGLSTAARADWDGYRHERHWHPRHIGHHRHYYPAYPLVEPVYYAPPPPVYVVPQPVYIVPGFAVR